MQPRTSCASASLAANLALVRAGLVVLTFGNASAVDRDAGVMAIKPSGVPYDELDAGAIAVVDLESGAVVDGGPRPSSDTPTHLVLYRAFAGVGGIVHTHSPFATAWAQAGASSPASGRRTPITSAGRPGHARRSTAAEIDGDYERATGEVIVETFAALGLDPLEMPAALVASHGPFVWGAGAEDAVENAVALEAVAASCAAHQLLRADVAPIADELLRRHFHASTGRRLLRPAR